MIKNVLHCPTVWQGTGPEPAMCLLLSLPLLTAMSMKEEYQLLLDEFPLLGVIACRLKIKKKVTVLYYYYYYFYFYCYYEIREMLLLLLLLLLFVVSIDYYYYYWLLLLVNDY